MTDAVTQTMSLWEQLLDTLSGGIKRKTGKDMVLVNVESGADEYESHERYLSAVFEAVDRDEVIVCLSIPDGELVRYPYLNVEWRVTHGKGKVGMTGVPQDCEKAVALLRQP